MSAMDEVFGSNPDRPTHPDFWVLSEVVLGMDGATDEAALHEGEAARDKAFTEVVESVINKDVLIYVCMQRVRRSIEQLIGIGMFGNAEAGMSAAWIDGFMAGAGFQQRKNKTGPGPEEEGQS